jgi:FAD synthase
MKAEAQDYGPVLKGEVVSGFQDQSKGFKTANINVEVGRGAYICQTNYGPGFAVCIRPGELEVHILGFDGDIYGETLEVSEIKEIDKKLFLNIGLIINDRPPEV